MKTNHLINYDPEIKQWGQKRYPSLNPYFIDSAKRLAKVKPRSESFDVRDEAFMKIIRKNLSMINGSYMSTNRYYHSLGHIDFFIRKLIDKKIRSHVEHFDLAVVSSFFHDLFIGSKDSVLVSAMFSKYFLKDIGLSPLSQDIVFENIMATDHLCFAKSNDSRIIADIDLLPLSLPEKEFRKNTALLMLEVFPQKDSKVFFQEICQFFRMLQKRGAVFQMDIFREHEDAAQTNLFNFLKENMLNYH